MKPVDWVNGEVVLIDQTKLPQQLITIACSDYRQVAIGIKTMQVRGAPAIGVAAALGLALAAQQYRDLPAEEFFQELQKAQKTLAATRPTAVNLFWALEAMVQIIHRFRTQGTTIVTQELVKAAIQLAEEDLKTNHRIGAHGLRIVPDGARILTHCNAGALATVGYGTALGVIRAAHEDGKLTQVYADETRPLLQGARLTAWELYEEDIPVTLITDNMAGYVMSKGLVDLVIVGADRIAANGDVANKIGTYSVAVLAQTNGIPFYVAAPLSTFDFGLSSGEAIPIEERDPAEVTHINGHSIAPVGVPVLNPAFDVTPGQYISGIITEVGILRPPYNESIKVAGKQKRGAGGND